MGGGKGIFGVVYCCYDPIRMALPCMISICGSYMASAILMSSMVIGKFLV